MKSEKLKEEFAALSQEMRGMIDAAEKEDRGFTTEEDAKYAALGEKRTQLEARIKRQVEYETLSGDDESGDTRGEEERINFERRRKSFDDRNRDPEQPLNDAERCLALRAAIAGESRANEHDLALLKRSDYRFGETEFGPGIELTLHRGHDESGCEFSAPQTKQELREQAKARRSMSPEERAVQITTTANLGGNLVPNAMMAPLDKALLAFGGMRQTSTVRTTDTGGTWQFPTVNDTGNKSVIIGEGVADTEQEFNISQDTLGAFTYSTKLMLVSYELMQDSATNVSALVGELIGERNGRGQNEHFTVGTGSGQPRGITLDAVDSSVTFSLGTPDYLKLLDLKHSVDPAYRAMGAGWIFADAILLRLKKLKTTDGLPVWQPGIAFGAPDTIDGDPYQINQDMPITATGKGIIYGALQKYVIREVRGITVVILRERYADKRSVGMFGYSRADGRVIHAGANSIKFASLVA